jgi:hypothetical protein
MQRFFKVVGNAKIFSKWWEMRRFFQSGFIVMGNRPRWKILKVVRNAKISQNGFIVMGNRPRWKMKRVFKEV